MKKYAAHFIAIAGCFSLSCFAQHTNYAVNTDTQITSPKADNKSNEGRVIDSYLVVEIINMPFGKRITKYEVSKLDMVYTNDLGPNNTRTVTPIYKKTKVRTAGTVLASKTIADPVVENIEPIEVEVTAPAYTQKSVSIDILGTYANVLDKGYKSIDMLKKVADKNYFEGNYEASAKYYAALLDLDENVEAVYYVRYVESLKATNQTEKANEVSLLFESKNLKNDAIKQTKLVKN